MIFRWMRRYTSINNPKVDDKHQPVAPSEDKLKEGQPRLEIHFE